MKFADLKRDKMIITRGMHFQFQPGIKLDIISKQKRPELLKHQTKYTRLSINFYIVIHIVFENEYDWITFICEGNEIELRGPTLFLIILGINLS